MLNEYRGRRDQLMEWFSVDPRFECVKPAGAFYLFPRITKVLESTGIASSAEFSRGPPQRGARRADRRRGI